MRVLRPVVQSFVLPMFHVQSQVTVCRGVALELVGDQNARWASVLPEQLSHEPFGRMAVAPALHPYVEYFTVLVRRAPQPVFLAVAVVCYFVDSPLIVS